MGIQFIGPKEPGRNEPCPCESGLKYKHCHGDALKRELCNRAANECMAKLITEEQYKKLTKGQFSDRILPDMPN